MKCQWNAFLVCQLVYDKLIWWKKKYSNYEEKLVSIAIKLLKIIILSSRQRYFWEGEYKIHLIVRTTAHTNFNSFELFHIHHNGNSIPWINFKWFIKWFAMFSLNIFRQWNVDVFFSNWFATSMNSKISSTIHAFWIIKSWSHKCRRFGCVFNFCHRNQIYPTLKCSYTKNREGSVKKRKAVFLSASWFFTREEICSSYLFDCYFNWLRIKRTLKSLWIKITQKCPLYLNVVVICRVFHKIIKPCHCICRYFSSFSLTNAHIVYKYLCVSNHITEALFEFSAIHSNLKTRNRLIPISILKCQNSHILTLKPHIHTDFGENSLFTRARFGDDSTAWIDDHWMTIDHIIGTLIFGRRNCCNKQLIVQSSCTLI